MSALLVKHGADINAMLPGATQTGLAQLRLGGVLRVAFFPSDVYATRHPSLCEESAVIVDPRLASQTTVQSYTWQRTSQTSRPALTYWTWAQTRTQLGAVQPVPPHTHMPHTSTHTHARTAQ